MHAYSIGTYIIFSVDTVADIDKITDYNRVYLFILACNEKGTSPNKLKILL